MTRRIGERHPHAPAPLLATAALALILAGTNAGLAWADELPANEPAKQQTPQVEALPQDAESNASANTTSTPDASAKNGTEAADAAASASASSVATSNGANTASEETQSTNNRQNVNTGSSSNASKAPAQPVYDYLQSKTSPHLTYTKDGKPCKTYGWAHVNGSWYWFNNSPYASENCWRYVNGSWYHFDAAGAMQTGWVYTGGAWYLLGNNGAMRTGWQKVSGTWYYLDKQSGAMHTGWLKDGGTWYYLYGSGAMATGWVYVGGAYYYLNSSGAWDPNADPMYRKAQGYSSNTNWLILCDTTRNQVCIYWGSKGNWKLQKNWTCTTGAWDTPTVLGQFTVGAKGYVFGSGFSCYYYTQFCGNYLFHSVTYYQNTFNIMDGRLGMNLSHGCVRLQIDNAKWIYDNIPSGTKVVTF
ncbi:L,D-transpeptidase family protein [Senegalimassilia faecalis]|uniref:L,D-transpeptidase family protein n=1 Tax=Senegalimassilia faecalis TaxID=2509433 RepID=UPI00307788B9